MTLSSAPMLAVALLLAGLSGCVRPDQLPPEPSCQGWQRYWCEEPPHVCEDCCPAGCFPPCHADGPNASADSCPEVCSFSGAPAYGGCGPAPAPPFLGPFEARAVAGCTGCHEVAVAARHESVALATARGLQILAWGGGLHVEAPSPSVAMTSWSLTSPAALAEQDGFWYAALASSGPAREVVLGRWEGGTGWERVATIGAATAPVLPLVEDVWIAAVRGGLVLVLAGAEQAWALRSSDGGASFGSLDPIVPAGGKARVGAPTTDARGRLLVPYAWSPSPADAPMSGGGTTSLHYASLGDAGAPWTFHGGMGIPQGIDDGTRPALVVAESAATFLWVDHAGTLVRLESTDEGVSWSPSVAWSDPATRATGTPAGGAVAFERTAAWWEEDGALVLARVDVTGRSERADAASAPTPASAAALALDPAGRAVVAWADGESVWVVLEGGMFACDRDAHCPRWW